MIKHTICRECNKEFRQNAKARPKVFCSGKCRVKHNNGKKRQIYKKVTATYRGGLQDIHTYFEVVKQHHVEGELGTILGLKEGDAIRVNIQVIGRLEQ